MVILKVRASRHGIDILTVLTYEISKTGKKVEHFPGSNPNPEKQIVPPAGMLTIRPETELCRELDLWFSYSFCEPPPNFRAIRVLPFRRVRCRYYANKKKRPLLHPITRLFLDRFLIFLYVSYRA